MFAVLEVMIAFLAELFVFYFVDWFLSYWMFPFLSGRYERKVEQMREEKWFEELYQQLGYGELIRNNRRVGKHLLRRRKRRGRFFARERDRMALLDLLRSEAVQ